MSAYSIMELSHRANVERMLQLAQEADRKAQDYPAGHANRHYYSGVCTGLRRAIRVLESQG